MNFMQLNMLRGQTFSEQNGHVTQGKLSLQHFPRFMSHGLWRALLINGKGKGEVCIRAKLVTH